MAAGIAVATSRINGRLAEKFQVPFAEPFPELIQVVATTLAASWAMRNVFSGAEHMDQLEYAKSLEAEGKALLDEIYTGALRLTDAATLISIPGRTPPISVTGSPSMQLRTMDMLGQWGPKVPDNYYWNTGSYYYPGQYP